MSDLEISKIALELCKRQEVRPSAYASEDNKVSFHKIAIRDVKRILYIAQNAGFGSWTINEILKSPPKNPSPKAA